MSSLSLQDLTAKQNAQRALGNAVILSSIIELSTAILRNIANKDVEESIKNDGLTKPVLVNMVANRIKQNLTAKESA